ncbi:septum formation initiator family protein [Candidatus Uhrbacteria bacterium]|nr:septum formation initiator family protein [Candidatus Uhrbacteria bacterium]
MTSYRQSFISRLIRWRFLVVVNVVIIVFLGLTFGREFFRSREIQSEINKLQSQADTLAARNIALSELQTAIQTESFIEREARLKLGMKKPGEEVVVIQEGGEGDKGRVGEEENDPLNLVLDDQSELTRIANSTKWWYYFFDKKTFDSISKYEN